MQTLKNRPSLTEQLPAAGVAFTEKQAAHYLSISLSTLRRWRRSGIGPVYFRHGNVLRYGRKALDEFIAKNTKTAD